jgi:hypothetical protein
LPGAEWRGNAAGRLTAFAHACRLGAEGIVSKKVDGTYRSGPSRVWIKVRNPASIAVQGERSEIWNHTNRRMTSWAALPVEIATSGKTLKAT